MALRNKKKWWFGGAAALCLGLVIAAVETPLLYLFAGDLRLQNTIAFIVEHTGSEARFVKVLERQGFEVSDVNGSRSRRISFDERFFPCGIFSGLKWYEQRRCRDRAYQELAEKLGADPYTQAKIAHVQTLHTLFFFCEGHLSVIWIADGPNIHAFKARAYGICP